MITTGTESGKTCRTTEQSHTWKMCEKKIVLGQDSSQEVPKLRTRVPHAEANDCQIFISSEKY